MEFSDWHMHDARIGAWLDQDQSQRIHSIHPALRSGVMTLNDRVTALLGQKEWLLVCAQDLLEQERAKVAALEDEIRLLKAAVSPSIATSTQPQPFTLVTHESYGISALGD